MPPHAPARRLAYIETTRGVASVIVVFHHFLLGFYPLLKTDFAAGGLRGTPLYVLCNGTGAVAFFFTLSGFVLTQGYYRNFRASDLAASVLKRLPRLMLPAGFTLALGAAILIYLPSPYIRAAALSRSEWLGAFANAGFPPGFVPGFVDALKDSLLVFLERNHSRYNSNLWTMVFEFYGSLLVFGLVALQGMQLRLNDRAMIKLHLALIPMTLISPVSVYLLPFVIGSLLAFLHGRKSIAFRLPRWAIWSLTAVVIAGYSFENWTTVTLASAAAMYLLLAVPSLERRLGGPMGLFLGRLSFPLYLVHVLVILSLTSATFAALTEVGLPFWAVIALSLGVTWVASIIAALPFMALERIWVPALGRGARAVVELFSGTGAPGPKRNLP